jgi:hypothetical protein
MCVIQGRATERQCGWFLRSSGIAAQNSLIEASELLTADFDDFGIRDPQ